MSPDPKRQSEDQAAAQQRFLSLFLRSEREIFRYVAALVPNAADAEDIVQQTALALWEKFDAYDPSQPFTPWACRFALNKAKQWVEGRWPDKHALEFRSVSDRVRLSVPGEFESLTLAAWVRVQGLDRQFNSLFMCDGFKAETLHWLIRKDGVLGLTR